MAVKKHADNGATSRKTAVRVSREQVPVLLQQLRAARDQLVLTAMVMEAARMLEHAATLQGTINLLCAIVRGLEDATGLPALPAGKRGRGK
jgi:hypothetical protein